MLIKNSNSASIGSSDKEIEDDNDEEILKGNGDQRKMIKYNCISEIVSKLTQIEINQAFNYINVSRTGLITYPEFELGLDLLFPNILVHYAKTTKVKSPQETPSVTNFNESFSKKVSSIQAKSKIAFSSHLNPPQSMTKQEDFSRFTKFFFKRLDNDHDSLLNL